MHAWTNLWCHREEKRRQWPMVKENVDQSSNKISQQTFANWMHLPFPFIIKRLLLIIIIITTLLNYRFDFLQITRKRSACFAMSAFCHGHVHAVPFICFVVNLLCLAGYVCECVVCNSGRQSKTGIIIIIIHHFSLYYAWIVSTEYRAGR